MIPYASHTNGARNLDELRRYGWHLLRTPFTTGESNHGFRYALDNGAWRAHQRGEAFDAEAFESCLKMHGRGAEWIAVPDIVCGGLESLDFSLSWIGRLRKYERLLLICVQDGMEDHHLEPLIGPGVGIFVGGSTEFKESSSPRWGRLAHRAGAYLHVGRVNTVRRISICAEAGADSFDGSGASKFSVTVRRLTMASKQGGLFSPANVGKPR